MFIKENFDEFETCKKRLAPTIIIGDQSEPERGIGNKPNLCWRIWNIRREMQEHKEYYQQFKQTHHQDTEEFRELLSPLLKK